MPRLPNERTHIESSAEQLAALRNGDEAELCRLVDTHHAALVRLAAHYVPDMSVAEEVAQETWIAFLQSLDRFEGRSSLKTWLFRTLLNCARNRKRKEIHSVPFSAVFDPDAPAAPSVDSTRFRTQGPWAGHWAIAPRAFEIDGEHALLQQELSRFVERAIEALTPQQREVVNLRDVEGWSAEETCEVLGISEANQRVLLHRARSKVRAELERYLHSEQGA